MTYPTKWAASITILVIMLAASLNSFLLAQAQNSLVTIRGIVATTEGKKLDAAGVFLDNTKYNALSNPDGSYIMKNVPHGSYTLVCTFLGYIKFEKQITVGNNSVEQINIVLEPDVKVLDQVVIIGQIGVNTVQRMPETEGTMIYAAKRNDVIQMDRQNSNTPEVVARQIFAKVPGVNIWDFDGSGNQVSVATRGLNPHRSIEMNMRQDGYNINSDLFGYPEAHYAPAMEGVDRIEVIRGSAALQYGPQFGGLMNFIMRDGDENDKFTFQTQETAGSNGLISLFNSVGGTVDKVNYYSYFNYRRSNGYRPNSGYYNYSAFASVGYKISPKLSMKFDYSFLYYVDQMAGGLDDSMFYENPYQSTRSRNYFQPMFNIPALLFNLKLSENTTISLVSNLLAGQRNSVMFIQPPTVADTINASTLEYSPRQVDRDYYSSFSNELRMLHSYSFLKNKSTLTTGVRFSDNRTHRQQRGPGTTGTDFDLSITSPYLTDLHFGTMNFAVFAENLFRLGPNFYLTPGVRLDVLKTTSSGYINYLPADWDYDKLRNIPLFGCGAQFDVSEKINVYSNISQAYKPVLYSDLVPSATLDQVNPELKDSHGYQVDLGIRGSIKDILRFDAGLYYLYYGDRIGNLTLKDSSGNNYNYKTNTGTSTAKGIEIFVEFHPLNWAHVHTAGDISIFSSTSTDNANYLPGSTVVANGNNVDISGNDLENAPDFISRTGITYSYRWASLTFQYSYTSQTYSDASNTVFSPTGVTGIVPGYGIFDLNGIVEFGKFNVKGGINNLSNAKYFTRRINTYPGPGILPGDGRTFYLSAGLKI